MARTVYIALWSLLYVCFFGLAFHKRQSEIGTFAAFGWA
jgi:hypothetical protein